MISNFHRLWDEYAFTVSTILAIVAVARIMSLRIDSEDSLRLPPNFDYFLHLIRGKFNFKENGPIKMIEEGYKSKGEIFRIRLLHRHVTFLIGAEASSLVFSSNDAKVSAKKVYGFMIPVFGKGIVYDATSEVMAQQTKWIFFGLKGNYLQMYCHKIFLEAHHFFEQLPENSVRDVHKDMLELVSFTASRCLLGDEIRENLTSEIGQLLKDLSDGVSHVSIFFPRLPTEKHRRRDAARKKIVAIVDRIIKHRRKNGVSKHDYLQHLMDSAYRDGSKPTEEEIGGLVLATLFGGQHTSSNVLTWLTMMTLKHKEMIPNLREEQKNSFEESKMFTLKQLEEMSLLHNSIREILRLFPPLIILAREVTESLVYKNYYVPKGDIVAVSPSVTHKLPQVYKNPNKFDPSRFSKPREEGKGRYEFQPFGGGRHICIGRHFAFIQIKIVFSVMIQMFDMELVDSNWEPRIDYSNIIAGPYENNFVRLKRRIRSKPFFDAGQILAADQCVDK